MARFARVRHEAFERMGPSSLSRISSSLPGLHLIETTQRHLDAAHSGTANFVTHQVESEYGRLIKKLPAKSELAAQFSAAVSVCDKARTNPLDLLGRRGLETLKDKSNLSKMTFKPQRALALFSGDKAETRLRKGVNSLADVSRAVICYPP